MFSRKLAKLGYGPASPDLDRPDLDRLVLNRAIMAGALRGNAGKAAGALGKTATSAVTTFATTYAIGKVADAYCGVGCTLEAVRMKEPFARELERRRTLFARYQGDVQQPAAMTNLGKLTRQWRGQRWGVRTCA